MTRDSLIRQLRELANNPYLWGADEQTEEGFHVSEYDLSQMSQQKLKTLLAQVDWNPSDKGIWFNF